MCVGWTKRAQALGIVHTGLGYAASSYILLASFTSSLLRAVPSQGRWKTLPLPASLPVQTRGLDMVGLGLLSIVFGAWPWSRPLSSIGRRRLTWYIIFDIQMPEDGTVSSQG